MIVKKKEWQQVIPQPLETVWNFFSRPENLEAMTPEGISFEILSDIKGVEMYPGMIIQYNIAPFLGIKMNWVTEILQVKEHEFFIDLQRFGPYAFWHHQHHFELVAEGVRMRDLLHYKVPYGLIGTITDRLWVDRKIEEIFSFRKGAVERFFGKP